MENFKNALQGLATLKQVNDYGMFQMTYIGDYGFDNFLKIGVTETEDADTFTMKHLLTDIPIDYSLSRKSKSISGTGCTVFTARNEKGEVLFCRNYDFMYGKENYSPALQLFTSPINGYSSVSTVNLLFCGYDEETLPSGLTLDSFPVLSSPYEPMDGVNSKGVAVAILSVPTAEPAFDENKVTLNQLTTIRLVLDKAANVEEALNLLRQYNICFELNICCQFLIADAVGRSVIVNYCDGGMKVTDTHEPYQIASNFAACNHDIRTGICEFERYDKVKAALANNNGVLPEQKVINLLADVGCIYEGKLCLQWSVIYNLTTLEGVIFANGTKDRLTRFSLEKQ